MGFFSSYSGNDKQVVNVEFVLKMLDKLIPPIGFIYISTSSANPDTVYPGTTWVAWGSGRVPVGVDTSDSSFNMVEKTGGEKTHTLTVNEMPKHTHTVSPMGKRDNDFKGGDERDAWTFWYEGTINTGETGKSDAHNNLQPYITCFMWKRTA
jgi:hypothetical protein